MKCQRIASFAALLLAAMAMPAVAARETSGNTVLDETGAWTPCRDAMSGTTVVCRAVLPIAGGRETAVRGVFSPGLEFESLDDVRADGAAVNAAYYTALTRELPEGCGVEIRLAEGFAAREAEELEIRYTLAVTQTAGERGGASFSLELSDGSGGWTAYAPGEVRSGSFTVFRGVSLSGAPAEPLSGACFCLYYDAGMTRRVSFRRTEGNVYTACGAESCAHTRHENLLHTDASGQITVSGLPRGVYYLREICRWADHPALADGLEVCVAGSAGAGETDVPIRLELTEQREDPKHEPDDPLAFYVKGSRFLTAVLTVLLLGRRRPG